MAEDCILAQPIERLLWRKLTLKLGEAAAIYDPERALDEIISTAGTGAQQLLKNRPSMTAKRQKKRQFKQRDQASFDKASLSI